MCSNLARKLILQIILVGSICILPQVALAVVVTSGTVVSVSDGDTLSVLTDDHQLLVIRLAEIDAPERDQPFGDWSKQLLGGLTAGQHVTIVSHGTDRYGRVLADLWANTIHINRELVQRGAAWAYRRYVTDAKLLDLEAEARQSQRGLWLASAVEAIPPWQWRTRKRKPECRADTKSAQYRHGCPISAR